jgi:hypothetical protein
MKSTFKQDGPPNLCGFFGKKTYSQISSTVHVFANSHNLLFVLSCSYTFKITVMYTECVYNYIYGM